jgi:hypothetical protein
MPGGRLSSIVNCRSCDSGTVNSSSTSTSSPITAFSSTQGAVHTPATRPASRRALSRYSLEPGLMMMLSISMVACAGGML